MKKPVPFWIPLSIVDKLKQVQCLDICTDHIVDCVEFATRIDTIAH